MREKTCLFGNNDHKHTGIERATRRTTCSACHSPTSPPRSTAPEAAAQQLASRPRRRLRNSPEPDRDDPWWTYNVFQARNVETLFKRLRELLAHQAEPLGVNEQRRNS
jgi:hypothetical protein